MATRDDLHALVDSLPEDQFERAESSLRTLQDLGSHLRRAQEEAWEQIQAISQGRSGSGSLHLGVGSARKGRRGWFGSAGPDGDGWVAQGRFLYDGHEFTVRQQFVPDAAAMVYTHEISGPRGKRDVREVIFQLSERKPD
jgi:hypothetical protein